MITSTQLKSLLAGVAAVAVVGTAIAQGNPPNANVTNPAVGAGQQSSQGTPMGTTGTPGTGSAVGAAGSTSGSTAASTGSSTTMGASGSTDTTAATTTPRTARADRN